MSRYVDPDLLDHTAYAVTSYSECLGDGTYRIDDPSPIMAHLARIFPDVNLVDVNTAYEALGTRGIHVLKPNR
ncbi:MAG: hypothetical protein GF368_04910 [Candidatus Aenigmarchaeota archaeon]|nr:hypothetical protein [Candidatus Aenigmarchaeota archaeon]